VSEEEHRLLSISWSSLRAHLECRQKAFLLRSGKRSPSGNIRQFFHGTVADRIMRTWLLDPQPGAMPGMVRATMDEEETKARETGDGVVRWRTPTDRAEMEEFCVELVTRLEPLLDEHVLAYDYDTAVRFKAPIQVPYLDGRPAWINLSGEIDLITRDPGGNYRVWDLKATADDSYWRKTLGQLTFYDVCVQEMVGVPPVLSGLIQPMCKAPVLTFSFGEKERTQLLAAVARMASDIWQRDFRTKDGTSGCSWCPVRHACERYKVPQLRVNAPRLDLQAMRALAVSASVESE
jgi:PD-(D/E)XK nuclease superfamily